MSEELDVMWRNVRAWLDSVRRAAAGIEPLVREIRALEDARDEYKMLDKVSAETSANFHAVRDRMWSAEAERDELREMLFRIAEHADVPHDRDLSEFEDETVTRAIVSWVDQLCRRINALEDDRDDLQARVDKANGENKGLKLSIDEQKEAIAQRKKTIGKLTRDNKKVWKTVHELQAKLDGYESTHVELPRDANGEVFRLGCTAKMVDRHPEVLLTVHSMTMCDDGMWRLYACDDKDKYSCDLGTSEFEVCEKPQDTAESIVRDLSIGAATESEAIERIEALNG